MNVQGSKGRVTKELRSQDRPKGNHNHQTGIGFLQEILSGRVVAQALRLKNGNAEISCHDLYGWGSPILSSSCGPIPPSDLNSHSLTDPNIGWF